MAFLSVCAMFDRACANATCGIVKCQQVESESSAVKVIKIFIPSELLQERKEKFVSKFACRHSLL